jgi:sugar phosphate isomerase/epimerase
VNAALTSSIPIFGISQSVLANLDMASDLDIACNAGFSHFAPLDQMVHRIGVNETIALLGERPLTISSYHTGLMVVEMSEAEADARLRQEIETAAALGAPVIVVCSGSAGALTSNDAEAVLSTRLQRVGPLARELGVVIGIEPLHPLLHASSFLHSLRDTARIAAQVESCGVIVDLVHLYWDRQFLDDIAAHIDVICLVHLANLDSIAMQERRWQRGALDGDVVPVAALVRAIHQAGYRGAYENEILGRQSEAECKNAAIASRIWFEQLWHGDGAHHPPSIA